MENLINEIEQKSNNIYENKVNINIKNKGSGKENESGYYNLNSNINNIKYLEKYYNIDKITWDGNCLFFY